MEKIKALASKETAVGILCIVLALACLFGAAPRLSKADAYPHTIQTLEDKQTDVLEMSGIILALSVAVGAVPGDATTAVSNQIAHLDTYLVFVLGVIMLEIFLVPLIGAVVCGGIAPLALILLGVFFLLHGKWQWLAALAIHALLFSAMMLMLIPLGVRIGEMVDKSFGTEHMMEEIRKESDEITEKYKSLDSSSSEGKKDSNILDRITGFGEQIEETLSTSASELVERARSLVQSLMKAVAAAVVSACLIPVAILFLMWEIMKVVFGYLAAMFLPKRKAE